MNRTMVSDFRPTFGVAISPSHDRRDARPTRAQASARAPWPRRLDFTRWRRALALAACLFDDDARLARLRPPDDRRARIAFADARQDRRRGFCVAGDQQAARSLRVGQQQAAPVLDPVREHNGLAVACPVSVRGAGDEAGAGETSRPGRAAAHRRRAGGGSDRRRGPFRAHGREGRSR